MSYRRLQKLRRRAFEAGVIGCSKMDEAQLLAALEASGRSPRLRSLWAPRPSSTDRMTAAR